MKRILLLMLSTVFVAAGVNADEPDFQKLIPAIQRFRSSPENAIAIRASGNTFQLVRRSGTEISAATGKTLLTKDSLPVLKFTQTGLWMEHNIDKNVTVDEPLPKEGAPAVAKWKKFTWATVGVYPNSAWPDFIEFALDHGLSGFEEFRYEGVSSYALSFASATPAQVPAGNGKLVLDPQFRSQMRLAPEYQPASGPNGFVVLLHDPHQNVAGRGQTLSGLRSFLSANSSSRFRFLVEGAYIGTTREIGFSGLDSIIGSGAQTSPALVYSLLNTYMINTPMAYRLLYDRHIRATAIDDNLLLRYSAPRGVRTRFEQLSALRRFDTSFRKLNLPAGGDARDQIAEIIGLSYMYLSADLSDVPDETLIEYYSNLSEMFRVLAKVGQQLSATGMQITAADLKAFSSDADGCQDEAAIYKAAHDRNITMIPNIIDAAKTYTRELPIAFIGSYHTQGIVAALKAAHIGYIVIEPRPLIGTSEAESRAFDRAIHPDTRAGYLTSARLNMGQTVPTPEEVSSFYRPKISGKIPRIESERSAGIEAFRTLGTGRIDVTKVFAAADENASLSGSRISSGGQSPPPPGDFSKAFAFFDPPEKPGAGSARSLVIVDPADERWRDDGRYEFLRQAVFKVPNGAGPFTPGVVINLYPDDSGARLFLTYYEPKSKRIYCFESDRQHVASLVPLPIGAQGKEVDMKAQVVRVIRLHGRTKNG